MLWIYKIPGNLETLQPSAEDRLTCSQNHMTTLNAQEKMLSEEVEDIPQA